MIQFLRGTSEAVQRNNPTFSYIRTHLPQCYLVRPTSTTGATGYISAFVSGYVADLAENM